MTCREKLAMEHPECVHEKYDGGCKFCPDDYGYCDKYSDDGRKMCDDWYELDCEKCWNEEIPTEKMKEEMLDSKRKCKEELNELLKAMRIVELIREIVD